MSKLRARRPSPALVISILALFVALGGSAYAATKIGSKNIKANAITTGKIKKDAVTGAKVKESTLGAVPNATNAVSATNATNFSRYFTSGLKKASAGTNTPLGSVGPFGFIGKCKDLGGGKAEAMIVITTSATDSFMSSASGGFSFEGGFDPGDEEQISGQVATTNPAWYGFAEENLFTAASPDGSVLLEGAANVGAGVFGSPCAFQVSALNGA